MSRMFRVSSLLIVLLLLGVHAECKDIIVLGRTYDIVEPDVYDEIMERVKQVDWKRILNPEEMLKKVKSWKPDKLVNLPYASKDRVFSVNLTWTLPHDIKDINGNIIYPRGYTFNPLDYVHYPFTLVVIDGKNPLHVKWFKKKYGSDPGVKLLITDGHFYELALELKRPVYYAYSEIVERFSLKAVPSEIRQKGNLLEVREYVVNQSNAGN